MTYPAYEKLVFHWGHIDPWGYGEGSIRLSHKKKFGAADVVTDGIGNITAMPHLLGKPCFGRPETFFRHGNRTLPYTLSSGRKTRSVSHRCGACGASGVRDACRKVSVERVLSDPTISAALGLWGRTSQSMHSEYVYVGPAGRYWTAVLKAIADRGPFANVNDAIVVEHDLRKVETRRKAESAARQRRRLVNQCQGLPPTAEFSGAAFNEQARRHDILCKLASDPSSPLINKMFPAGRRLLSNVWLASVMLEEQRIVPTGRAIASWLVERSLHEGMKFESLRTRVARDMKRIGILEDASSGPAVWEPFDPDNH